MNSTTKTFGPARVKFYNNYEQWAEVVRSKGWYLTGTHGGCTAQDANGTCRGFWAHVVKKGWIEV